MDDFKYPPSTGRRADPAKRLHRRVMNCLPPIGPPLALRLSSQEPPPHPSPLVLQEPRVDWERWADSSSTNVPDQWPGSANQISEKRQASTLELKLEPANRRVKTLPKLNKFIQGPIELDRSGTHTFKDLIGHEGKVSPSTETAFSDTSSAGPISMSPQWRSANAGPSTTPSHGRPRLPLPGARVPEVGGHSGSSTPTRPSDVGPWRRGKDYADPLFTPPKGREVSLFTPPSSPLSPLSSPEPVPRCVEMEYENDTTILFADEAQTMKEKGEENKQALQVYVLVPRLSKAERKTYLYRDEESLGSMPLVLPDPRYSCSLPRVSSSTAEQRSSTSAHQQPSFLPDAHCTSSSYLHPQRATKFVDDEERQSKTMGYEFYETDRGVHRARGCAGPSTSKAGNPASITKPPANPLMTQHPKTRKRSVEVVIPVPPHRRVRTASPPRPRPPSDASAPQNALIDPTSAPEPLDSPCNRCIAAGARCTWTNVTVAKAGSKKKRGPQPKSCDRCVHQKRCCVVDTSSAPEVAEERNIHGNPELDIEDEHFLTCDLVHDYSPVPGVNKGKGKVVSAVDDEHDNVDLVGNKKRKRVEREGLKLAKKARTEVVAQSTSSASIQTFEFWEELDDEALYSVVREPQAKSLWNVEGHVVRSDLLSRNSKGYRRPHFGSDEWYEERKKYKEEEEVFVLLLSGMEDEVTDDAESFNGDPHANVDDGDIDSESNTGYG